MGDRYAVERAIKRSGLPSPSRLILFVLLTHVTNGTLTIPSEYSPSITTLVEETDLSRGALTGHLNRLEKAGWVKRYRPTTKKALAERARTSYRITIPENLRTRSGDERVTRSSDGPVQQMELSRARTGPEEEQVRTRSGDGPVQDVNGTRSGDEHNPMSSSSLPSEEKRQGGVGGGRSRRKPETPVPEIFPVTDAMRAWSSHHKRTITVDLDDQTERFLNHARQTDRRCRDWLAAWRNWILKAQDFADKDRARAATGTDGTYGHGPRARVNDYDWSKGGPTV